MLPINVNELMKFMGAKYREMIRKQRGDDPIAKGYADAIHDLQRWVAGHEKLEKRGTWDLVQDCTFEINAVCSECRGISRLQSKFCPHCGAQMIGEAENGSKAAKEVKKQPMTQKKREKLMMIRGIVGGIARVVKDACVADALDGVAEKLDKVLEDEEGKDDQG